MAPTDEVGQAKVGEAFLAAAASLAWEKLCEHWLVKLCCLQFTVDYIQGVGDPIATLQRKSLKNFLQPFGLCFASLWGGHGAGFLFTKCPV